MDERAEISRSDFPADFAWGTATAAYQIEGAVREDGRGASIWDTFSHTPGKTDQGDTGDVADDHYHRYREDVGLMREMGLNAYRFSISWPRIIPEGRGKVNPKGLDFYERLVESLLENGIQPYATLYHWDLPQALQAKGGWKERLTSEAFAEYADVVSRRLGDRVKGWITLNEPYVAAIIGHVEGRHAPGEKDLKAGIRAAHHLLLGHGLALPVLRANSRRADAEFGITLSTTYAEPGDDSQQAQEAAVMVDGFNNRLFMDPLFKGRYPAAIGHLIDPHLPIESGDMEKISAKMDFLGINYYFRTLALAVDDLTPSKVKARKVAGAQYTEMGWEVHPEGFYNLLKLVHEDYNPPKILITENGAAFADKLEEGQGGPAVHDPDRLNYLRDHFEAALKASREGVPVKGYFVWSFLDNFEWAYGFSKRFGIVYVDYPTQRRIVKDSGRWYQRFLRGES
jgi:beta-glucosidase